MTHEFLPNQNNQSQKNVTEVDSLLQNIENNIDLTKEIGFEETNKLRKEKGLVEYTLDQYNDKFLKMHQKVILDNENNIKRVEENIERVKENLKKREGEISDLKNILSDALEKDNSDLIKRAKDTLESYEKTFDEDKLLEDITNYKKDIQGYEDAIKHSRLILEKITNK